MTIFANHYLVTLDEGKYQCQVLVDVKNDITADVDLMVMKEDTEAVVDNHSWIKMFTDAVDAIRYFLKKIIE